MTVKYKSMLKPEETADSRGKALKGSTENQVICEGNVNFPMTTKGENKP